MTTPREPSDTVYVSNSPSERSGIMSALRTKRKLSYSFHSSDRYLLTLPYARRNSQHLRFIKQQDKDPYPHSSDGDNNKDDKKANNVEFKKIRSVMEMRKK